MMCTAVLRNDTVMLLSIRAKREWEGYANVGGSGFKVKTSVVNGVLHLIQITPDKGRAGGRIAQSSKGGLEIRLQQGEIGGGNGFK